MAACAIVTNTSLWIIGQTYVFVKITISSPTIHRQYVCPVLLYTWDALAAYGLVATTVIVTDILSKTIIVLAACAILDILSSTAYAQAAQT